MSMKVLAGLFFCYLSALGADPENEYHQRKLHSRFHRLQLKARAEELRVDNVRETERLEKARGVGLPPCTHACVGLESIDFEDDGQACNYFKAKGFDCLSACNPKDIAFHRVSFSELNRECAWVELACDHLSHSSAQKIVDEDYCPQVCEHIECLKLYEYLKASKRGLDLHQRCARNCGA